MHWTDNKNAYIKSLLLPPSISQHHNLTLCMHTLQLPEHSTYLSDCNYIVIIRMLYKDSKTHTSMTFYNQSLLLQLYLFLSSLCTYFVLCYISYCYNLAFSCFFVKTCILTSFLNKTNITKIKPTNMSSDKSRCCDVEYLSQLLIYNASESVFYPNPKSLRGKKDCWGKGQTSRLKAKSGGAGWVWKEGQRYPHQLGNLEECCKLHWQSSGRAPITQNFYTTFSTQDGLSRYYKAVEILLTICWISALWGKTGHFGRSSTSRDVCLHKTLLQLAANSLT